MSIFTNTIEYSVIDLGFDKSLTKSLLSQQGNIDISPEMINAFTSGTSPRSLLSGELISSIEQQAGVIFSGKSVFDNTQDGYRLGFDTDEIVKFYVGTPTDYFNFDGTNIIISGT